MNNKKFIFIFLLVLLFFSISYVSAATIEYNFNSTYEGINIWAWDTGVDVGVTKPLDNVPHPSGFSYNRTNRSELDSSDDSELADSYYNLYPGFLFEAKVDIFKSDITKLNWTVEGKTDGFGYANYSIFNINTWESGGETLSDTDILMSIVKTNATNYINSSNYTQFSFSYGNTVFVDFIKLEITYTPTVTTTLYTPVNNTNYSNYTNNLICNASVTSDTLDSIKLYVWNDDGSLNQTNTTSVTGTSNSSNFTTTLTSDGIYKWACLSNSTQGESDFSENRTFTIDNTPPIISVTYPINNSNQSTNNFDINITYSDSIGIDTCWYSNDSGLTNTTFVCSDNITGVTWQEGNTNLIIYINDTVGNENKTDVSFFTETLENVTFCRNLTIVNGVYYLGNNISTDSTCLNIMNNNISLDLNNFYLNGDGGASDYGIYSNGYNDFKLFNGSINNFGTGLYFENSDNSIINDTNISSSSNYDIYLVTGSTGILLYNVSYDSSNEFVGGASNLTRLWYFNLIVNDTSQVSIENASVKLYNNNSDLIFYENTSSNGSINEYAVIQYTNNAGSVSNKNNHIINITKFGYYPNITSVNITSNNDYYRELGDDQDPTINIIYPTNEYNTTDTGLHVNFSFSDDIGFSTCKWTKDGGIINTTLTNCTNITGESWTNGRKTVTIYVIDTIGQESSDTINFTVDNVAPDLTLLSPSESSSFSTNESIDLNFSVSDDTLGVDTCWYKLVNSTGDILINNETIIGCSNTTFNISQGSGVYNLTIYSNDTLNNINSDSAQFSISLAGPAITLVSPEDNDYYDYSDNIYFNYTASDSNGVNTCQLYGNFTGIWSLNDTNTHSDSTPINSFFIKNLSEGSYLWTVKCNDSLGVDNWALSNYTLIVDTTAPYVNITSPSNNTVVEGQTVSINYNITDKNINICYFTLRNSTGDVHNYAENTSISCSESGSRSLSVLSYGNYSATFYGQDIAGNVNFSTVYFSSISPTTPPSTGGGGSTTETIYVGNASWTMKTVSMGDVYDIQMTAFSLKDREIIFVNQGDSEVNLTLTCDGDLCDGVRLSKTSLVLPIGKSTETKVIVVLEIPRGVEDAIYVTNIIATDQLGNSRVVTFNIKVGADPTILLIDSLNKLIETKVFSDNIKVPYFLIVIVIWLVSSVILSLIISSRVKFRKAIIILGGFFIGLSSLFWL